MGVARAAQGSWENGCDPEDWTNCPSDDELEAFRAVVRWGEAHLGEREALDYLGASEEA